MEGKWHRKKSSVKESIEKNKKGKCQLKKEDRIMKECKYKKIKERKKESWRNYQKKERKKERKKRKDVRD